ncbi:hypothetical protein PROFUN_03217 [Planoprotostelium fungivorum]|uniref:Coactosin n=1 Tax=Planoprotostelium fungivorum TaxID=1890364 RepID=A0A2P6NX13_9EUKA|nr:hypothetical protein PROFUN_03217 [Planoprotostelium fungivorum]
MGGFSPKFAKPVVNKLLPSDTKNTPLVEDDLFAEEQKSSAVSYIPSVQPVPSEIPLDPPSVTNVSNRAPIYNTSSKGFAGRPFNSRARGMTGSRLFKTYSTTVNVDESDAPWKVVAESELTNGQRQEIEHKFEEFDTQKTGVLDKVKVRDLLLTLLPKSNDAAPMQYIVDLQFADQTLDTSRGLRCRDFIGSESTPSVLGNLLTVLQQPRFRSTPSIKPPEPRVLNMSPNLSLEEIKRQLTLDELSDAHAHFARSDVDQSGFIDKEELKAILISVMGENATPKMIQEFVDSQFSAYDKDGNGQISFDEFIPLYIRMTNQAQREPIVSPNKGKRQVISHVITGGPGSTEMVPRCFEVQRSQREAMYSTEGRDDIEEGERERLIVAGRVHVMRGSLPSESLVSLPPSLSSPPSLLFSTETMADVSDPELAQAYQEVRQDSNNTDWVVYGYEGNAIKVQAKGSGDLDAVKSHFQDDQAQYAFVRVTSGDAESKRAKFVFISWCGEGVGALKRAKMSVHKASVKSVVKDFGIELHATTQADLNAEELAQRVKKASGADYSGNSN